VCTGHDERPSFRIGRGLQRAFSQISALVKPPGTMLQANIREMAEMAGKENAMNIVIAAEKTSIATLLSQFVKRHVNPDEIKVSENPDETGSFFVGLQCDRFVLSPNGVFAADKLQIRG
jgi:hypothetical protein